LPGSAFIQLIEAIDPVLPRGPRAVIAGEAEPRLAVGPQNAAA
jgi:hypothetical protein